MRRFLAYIIMLVTLIGAVAFNTQKVLGDKVNGMEYDQGTQLVYSLSKRNKEDYVQDDNPNLYRNEPQDLDDIDIEGEVMDRLSQAGVRDADVTITMGNEQNVGYQLKVTLSPLSDTDLSNVQEILSRTGTLSIGTSQDHIFSEEKGDTFGSPLASIVYVDNIAYPAINLKDSNAYDAIKKAVDEAGNNDSSSSSNSSDDSSSKKSIAYLWMNRTSNDTYAYAYGNETDHIVAREEVKNKVLAEVDLSNYSSDNNQIRLTTDTQGNAFTSSTARAFVTMLNAKDYGFDLTYLYSNRIHAKFGSRGLNKTYLAFGIALAIVALLLIVFYGLAGISGAVTLFSSVFASFWLSSLLGFEFSVSFLAGLVVVAMLSALISVNYFTAVQRELKKGHDLEKANKDGYHRSWLLGMDISFVALIASIFSFLIAAGSLRTFFGVIMIGTVFTFLITNFFDRWMMYWLTKGSTLHLPYFSFFPLKEKKAEKKGSSLSSKKSKALMITLPSLAALLLAIVLPIRGATGDGYSYFHNAGDYASDYTLNIQFRLNGTDTPYAALENKSTFLEYIQEVGEKSDLGKYQAVSDIEDSGVDFTTTPGFIYYESTANVNTVTKKDDEGNSYVLQYFSVETDRDLNSVRLAAGNTPLDVIRSTLFETQGSFTLEDGTLISPASLTYFSSDSEDQVVSSYLTVPTHIAYNTNNFFLVVFLIAVFAMIYTFLRYGLNLALAQLGYGTVISALGVGLLSLLPIPFDSFTVFGVLLVSFLANLIALALLGRNKQVLKEKGLKKTATAENKLDTLAEVSSDALPMVLIALATGLFGTIAFFFVSSSLLGMGLISLILLVLAVVYLPFFLIPFYGFLATHISFKKVSDWMEERREKRRIKKHEKKATASADGIVYVDQDSPHETIIVGLNEFRR